MNEDFNRELLKFKRYRDIFDALEYSMSLIDQEHRYVFVNRSFSRYQQVPVDQIKGKHIRDVWGDETYELYIRPRLDEVFAGEVVDRKFSRRDEFGKDLFFEVTFSPHRDDGILVSHAIVVQRDVTEKKHFSNQLQHTERLDSLGVLAGGIAHDFNNILTVISGHATMAQFIDQKNVHVQAHLEKIGDAVDKAATLCQQMLAYAGKGTFKVQPVNLSSLIEGISNLLEVARNKRVEVVYELEYHIPKVMCDEGQMQQVMMNLMTNASEAIGDMQGTITIASGLRRVDGTYISQCQANKNARRGLYVFVRVTDNGCGMDSNTLDHLFDPFFTTKFKGRGLGMSAILGIVDGHNGLLKVQSVEGQGTRITVLLPVVGKKKEEA